MDKLKTEKPAKDAENEENGSFAKGCLFGTFISLPIWMIVYFFLKKWISY